MLRIKEMPSLKALQALDTEYTAEELLELQLIIRPLVVFQLHPDIALTVMSRVTLPPHQRTILNLIHHGAGSNVIVASRGTAKSSTVAVLYSQYLATLFTRRKLITLSYTGFRGGQQLFMDAETFLHGGWDSQRQDIPFFRASIPRGHKQHGKFDTPMYRGQNLWRFEYDSFSTNTTLPTKDHDAIRGQRGNDLILDEANFLDKDLIEKVAIPFLNVTGDFEGGGENAAENRVFYISTVDYGWRPFQQRIEAAQKGIRRDYDAHQAATQKDWKTYYKLENDGLHEHTFMRFDYTDTLIRRYIQDREDGKTYEVRWPNPKIRCKLDRRGIPFTTRRPDGAMDRSSPPVEYYRTYPVEKKSLERNLRDGSADESSWKAENRNIVDSAIGDVYSNTLVDSVTCFGDRYLIPYEKCSFSWREQFEKEVRDFVPPVLWRCDDPCVIGVDYAPFSDFCAFVVIRIGPLSSVPEFDMLKCEGRTKWSNVIWAEQHRQMSHEDVASKIRALAERYRLVHHHDPYQMDRELACRAIGLDMRGGGSGVRDHLARVNQERVQPGEFRIYDPFDTDEKIAAFEKGDSAIPMLDAISPSVQLNERLVEFTKGQMEVGALYIAKYFDESQRPTNDAALHVGYEAVKVLQHQLRKIRQRPTQLYRQFYMEGDTDKDKNKKDLFSAFLYAAKQVRAHIIRQSQIDNTPPPLAALISHQASRKNNGRAPGSRGL